VHVLTKAFVVLAAILSIALSALVIAYAVNTDRVLTDYASLRDQKVAAETSYSAVASQSNLEQARLNSVIQDLQNQNATLAAESRRQQADLAQVRTEKNRAEVNAQSTLGKIAELGETAKTQATLITSYRDEVTTLRSNELQYRERALETENRLSDLESQREVLEQNYRALQEQIAEAARTQQQTLAGRTAGAETPFTPNIAINARVEAVQAEPGSNRTLVRVNVGTNDRVAKNMKLMVVREGQFLANLVIEQPDLRSSIARVDLLARPDVQIREGDLVLSRL